MRKNKRRKDLSRVKQAGRQAGKGLVLASFFLGSFFDHVEGFDMFVWKVS
jgi:hypothetical protein